MVGISKCMILLKAGIELDIKITGFSPLYLLQNNYFKILFGTNLYYFL